MQDQAITFLDFLGFPRGTGDYTNCFILPEDHPVFLVQGTEKLGMLEYADDTRSTLILMPEEINFDSWDWVMQVYTKIKDFLQNLERPSKNHCCKGDLLEVDIHCHLMQIDPKKMREAMIVFIEWYNHRENNQQ